MRIEYYTIENGEIVWCEPCRCECGALTLINTAVICNVTEAEIKAQGAKRLEAEADDYDPDECNCTACR